MAAEQEAAEQGDANEKAQRVAEERARLPAQAQSGPSLDDLVTIETDFDAALGMSGAEKAEAEKAAAAANDRKQQESEARRQAEERAISEIHESARAAAAAEDELQRKVDAGKKPAAKLASDDVAPASPVDIEALQREHAAAQAELSAQNAETERHFAEMEKEMEAEAAVAVEEERQTPPALPPDTGKRSRAEAPQPVRAQSAVPAMAAPVAAEESMPVYRKRVKWGKPLALGLFLLLLAGLGLIHVVSFDGSIPQFEKLAGEHLQQPVKIKSLHLSLVPRPHWRLDGVSVGKEGQFAAETINAVAELGSLFGEKKSFSSIELLSPVLSEDGLFALLFGKPQGQDLKLASISVKNGKLVSKTIILPALDAKILIGENGAWQKIALETPDRKTSLLLEPKDGGAQLELETNVFSAPFDHTFLLENFSAKGTIGRDQLRLSEFKGGIYGGYLSGSANLKWGTDWSLGGEVSVRAIDPARVVPALIEEGMLEAKAAYAMRAKSYDDLFNAPRLEGTFAVLKGNLLGVDLARLLQGGGMGGKTAFGELAGNFVRDGGRTQVQQLRLSAGPVSANGSADADARKNLSGRFGVDLKAGVVQAHANLALSGTLREPRFSR
jgi:hypothetical protein